MKKLEVFFDYYCPYCLKGHEQLLDFVPTQPKLEVIWHPCEIYKLPTNYSGTKHSDLCIQGMYFAMDNKIDLWDYHKKIYSLIFTDRVNVDNVKVFTKALDGFFDTNAFVEAVNSGKYVEKVNETNHYAFHATGVHVVPTFRADNGFLQDRQEFFNMGPSSTSYNGSK